MPEPAIRASRLSKQYRIGAAQERYKTLRETISGFFVRPLRDTHGAAAGTPAGEDRFWALRDVSFEVGEGEIVGIIGRNGAGKSTLLKILSRITAPTEGEARIRGRVGSLLEVGTGFHPELTGRENVYLNGAILGMGKREIDRKFDEIVSFAEVERFIDTPVKHYSTGMYLRMAFSVAAYLEPEILLVDEVLAVGDAAFQKKCLGRMGDVVHQGRTVLFVSHNMAAMQSLCSRVILLEGGRVADDGPARRVVSRYLSDSCSAALEREWPDREEAPGNDKVRLRGARIHSEGRGAGEQITIRTSFWMEFDFWNLDPGSCVSLSLHLFNEEGVTVFNTFPVDESRWHGKPFPKGLFRSSVRIPGDLLNSGTHRVLLLVVRDQGTVIYRHDDILVFDVSDDIARRGGWHGNWTGAVRPKLAWETEQIGGEDD